MKSLCMAFFMIFLMGQSVSAQEQKLVFHYPLYYFSPDKATNLKSVQTLASNIEQVVSEKFSHVSSKQKATVKMGGITYLGEIDAASLEDLVRKWYPAVVVVENDMAIPVLKELNKLKAYPMVLVLLNIRKGEDLAISENIPKVINFFGLDNNDYFKLSEEKNRFYNIAIKGQKEANLFQDSKMMAFVRDLLAAALMDAIASGEVKYGV